VRPLALLLLAPALLLPAGAAPAMAPSCGVPVALAPSVTELPILPLPDPALPAADLHCAPGIRPGASSNSCTLNFVVTDGTDLYIGAAGHCAYTGKRLSVAGVPGQVGTFVLVRNEFLARDWAFARIDPEDRAFVKGTLCRWAGPFANPASGADVRTPDVGDVALHYGHGVALGATEAARGRVGAVIPNVFGPTVFTLIASVSGGDSGSPVRLATGEAAGIVEAAALPWYEPTLTVAMRFDLAMEDLSDALGRPVALVDGDPLPPLPG
jgi:hypothetical protein